MVTIEDKLPLKGVLYGDHYNAFYDAEKGNKEEAYICECQRKSLENRIYMFSHVMKDHMLNDFIINKSYIPSRNIKQFLGFPSSISSKIDFSKNIISQLKFKDHICHKCNKVIPKISEELMNIENKRNNETIDWSQYFENYLVENGLYTRYSYDAKDTRCNNGFFQRELMRKDIRERFSVDFSMYNELINGVDKKTRSVFDELFNTEEKFYFFSLKDEDKDFYAFWMTKKHDKKLEEISLEHEALKSEAQNREVDFFSINDLLGKYIDMSLQKKIIPLKTSLYLYYKMFAVAYSDIISKQADICINILENEFLINVDSKLILQILPKNAIKTPGLPYENVLCGNNFFAYLDYNDEDIYMCKCQEESLKKLIRVLDRKMGKYSYSPNLIGLPIELTKTLNQFEFHEWPKKIKFKKNICHVCNGIKPLTNNGIGINAPSFEDAKSMYVRDYLMKNGVFMYQKELYIFDSKRAKNIPKSILYPSLEQFKEIIENNYSILGDKDIEIYNKILEQYAQMPRRYKRIISLRQDVNRSLFRKSTTEIYKFYFDEEYWFGLLNILDVATSKLIDYCFYQMFDKDKMEEV